MFIIFILSLVFAESLSFASGKVPLAAIKQFQGEVNVLRNPVLQKTPEFEHRVRSGLHQASFYQGWHWELYPVSNQTQIHYGDLISTGIRSSIQLRVSAAHMINLAENTVIQLLPDFIQLIDKRAAYPSVHVISGSIRIRSNQDSNFSSLSARSKSMVLSLDQADCIFAVKGKASLVLNLEGRLSAEKVSSENQAIYSQSLELYRNRKFRELGALTALRLKKPQDSNSEVEPGKKIESWEALSRDDQKSLVRLLGAEKARTYLETASGFEVVPIHEDDVNSFAQLLPDLEIITEKMEFSNSPDHGVEEGLERPTVAPDEREETEELSPDHHKLFSVQLGYTNLHNEFDESFSLDGRALALGLEVRPWKYVYSYLAISSGVADTQNMANFLGQGPPQPLNSYSHLAIGLGARYYLWKRLALSLGGSLVHIQRLSIQYEDLPANINRTYTVSWDPVPMAELGIGLNILSAMELFLRYGFGSSFARVEAKDISSDFNSPGTLSYGAIGLGWNTQ